MSETNGVRDINPFANQGVNYMPGYRWLQAHDKRPGRHGSMYSWARGVNHSPAMQESFELPPVVYDRMDIKTFVIHGKLVDLVKPMPMESAAMVEAARAASLAIAAGQL